MESRAAPGGEMPIRGQDWSSSETRSRAENVHVLSIESTYMENLWWAYATYTVIPMQELRGEEGGGLIIHVGV